MSDEQAPTMPKKKYFAGVYPAKDEELPTELGEALDDLQKFLQVPVWLLMQDDEKSGEWSHLGPDISNAFYEARRDKSLPTERIALVIDSQGGQAEDAYETAKVLQRHCGGFVAVIPRHAKSAATLLSLGADALLMGKFGELGPLDVQVADPEREQYRSGLDEVQALERLHAFVLSALDQTMFSISARTRMRVVTLQPHITKLVTDMTRPLFENIDVVRYTQMSRSLKVGEEYAKRLLYRNFPRDQATRIAAKFVESYPTHSFVIDFDEVQELGLTLLDPGEVCYSILDRIAHCSANISAIGRLIVEDV